MSAKRLLLLLLLSLTASAQAQQSRPHIGFVYPAGGQQGTTVRFKIGRTNMQDVERASITGTGVTVKVTGYFRKLEFMDMKLLDEQLQDLSQKMKDTPLAPLIASILNNTVGNTTPASPVVSVKTSSLTKAGKETLDRILKIQRRKLEYIDRPAYASIVEFVELEATIAPDAKPGPREIRLLTFQGVSDPLVFKVGQLPEVTRKPMIIDRYQILGKEHLAQRKRPDEEIEQRITLPCTVNGQVASGEVNAYRFAARKGQRLVIVTEARQLNPYFGDAVPGWFQPVLTLYDAHGKELAYNDDFRFKPDPVIFFEVPQDGEYVFAITDALYRGREDFVYRATIGELPFVTSIFPLGGREGALPKIQMTGWNLESALLAPPAPDAKPGTYTLAARDKAGFVSNRVSFAVDTLAECFDEEPNNDPSHAQKVTLPVIVNGRIDREDDWDVFQFTGKAGDTVVAEVQARRLDSPLDSLLKIADMQGNLLALNDDCKDLGSGLNTHHADSYVMVRLLTDGTYFVHLGDTTAHGGLEYSYRLRISLRRPDFALRVVPSSESISSKGPAAVAVHVLRKDGFDGPIKIALKDPPAGFSSDPCTSSPPKDPGTPEVARLAVTSSLKETPDPVSLVIEGRAMIEGREIAHDAVPADDKMQAFLWRHLLPTEDFKMLVFDPAKKRVPKRIPPPIPPEIHAKAKAAITANPSARFGKEMIYYRSWVLSNLYEEGLLADEFYAAKAAECEASR